MVSSELSPEHWEPRFLDYLYTSFTNVMAFSPTDTMLPVAVGQVFDGAAERHCPLDHGPCPCAGKVLAAGCGP